MSGKYNSNAKPNPGQHYSSFYLLAHSNAGLVFLFVHVLDTSSKTNMADPVLRYATLALKIFMLRVTRISY